MNTKLTINTVKSWFHSIVSIVAIALLATSCSTDKDINEGGGNLQINLKGIEEYVDADKIGKLASTSGLPKNGPVEIQSLNGFDVIANVEVQEPVDSKSVDKVATIAAPKNISKVASTVPLGSTVKYALAFYDESDNLVEGSPYEITGTTQPTIQLPLGQYKWVAYSINSTDLPTLTNGILAATDIANKDFIYASGNTTIETGFNYLELTFKRMTTLFEITLNARGMFGTINADTKVRLKYGDDNEYEYLKTNFASFNVLEGKYGTPSANAIELESSTWTTVSHNGAVKKISFSVLSDPSINIAANKLKLELSPLSIDLDETNFVTGYEEKTDLIGRPTGEDDYEKPIYDIRNPNRRFSSAIVNLKHNDLGGINGSKFKIEANLVESAIQVVENGAQWARSNLWYSDTNVDKYRFRVSPFYRDLTRSGLGYKLFLDNNDLWKFGAESPDGDPAAGIDPCSKVYPEGLWKMPLTSDFDALSDPDKVYVLNRKERESGGLLNLGLLSLFPSIYMESFPVWNKIGNPNATYAEPFLNDNYSGMDALVLNGVGYRDIANTAVSKVIATSSIGLLGNTSTVLSGFGGGSYYWAGDALRPNLRTMPYYYFNNFTSFELANVNLGILDLILINTDNVLDQYTPDNPGLTYNNKMSIRCVRNSSYPSVPITGGGSGSAPGAGGAN